MPSCPFIPFLTGKSDDQPPLKREISRPRLGDGPVAAAVAMARKSFGDDLAEWPDTE